MGFRSSIGFSANTDVSFSHRRRGILDSNDRK